jgi:23S rRNA pseudouridine2604 synthase
VSWRGTYSGAEPVRINKWLAQEGVCSRREAEALIEAGAVFVDGDAVREPGRKIERGQTIRVETTPQSGAGGKISLVIHKPVGFVSAQPEGHQAPAIRLVQPETRYGGDAPASLPRAGLPPLGRLDQDSRGLLILSDDGVLARALIGPESRIDKEYRVVCDGRVTREKIRLLRSGLHLDGRPLRPADVRLEADGALRFILTEGRNRQIRRMCELVGLTVTDLLRERIGPIRLGDLPEGRWRTLTPGERQAVLDASGLAGGLQNRDERVKDSS